MSSFLQSGQMVGARRFTLVKPLGRGGMGEVWLAHDTRLDESVALKFLPPEVASDSAALNDLRRETVRSHRLTHPNIIRIHDFQQSEGDAFISMEYVDGATLSDRRLQQPEQVLSWEQLAPLVQQLCAALEYAHGEGVIHRDLKPANVMLDGKGRVKLADFGIAAVMSDSVSRVSQHRPASGTLPYMSPQQLAGKRPTITDDIYSLGATIYELLTSKPPFYTGDITHQVLHEPPEPMQERLAALGIENGVPEDVAALIMACLAKEPAQRPQSAAAVAGWIGMEIARKPSVCDVTEDTERKTSIPARPGRKLVACGIILCLVAMAVTWWYPGRHRVRSESSNETISSGVAVSTESARMEHGAPGTRQLAVNQGTARIGSSGAPHPFKLQRASLDGMPSGSVAILSKGYPNYNPPTIPAGLGKVVAISGGGNHNLALTSDGKLLAWGAGTINTGTKHDHGQSIVPPGLDRVVAISAGWDHSLALRQDGTVVGWGRGWAGQTDPPADLTNAVAVAAGVNHSVALTSDGLVRVWGGSGYGAADVPRELDHVVRIASGDYHVLALKSDGTVVAWGGGGETNRTPFAQFGQADVPAGLKNVVAVAAGGTHSVALKSDGRVVVWGGKWPEVRAAPPFAGVVAIAANEDTTVALQRDGTVIAWGKNCAARTQITPALNPVIAIAAANGYGLTLTTGIGAIRP